MVTAVEARAIRDIAIATEANAPLRQVYGQINEVAAQKGSFTIVGFAPFGIAPGGSTDPAAAPFLNALAAGGFTLTASVDEAGFTSLRIDW